MVAPLRGKRGVVGTMLVANRLGDVSTFDTDDLKLFETLANHASVALENAQLVGRLEESLAQVTGTMRELEEAEARFRSLVQNASDVILVVQADATIRYETPSITRVLGYEPDQLNGAHFTTLLHPNDRERADAFFAEATNGGGSAVAEWRVRHRDGTWRHIEATCNNLLHDPAVNGVVTTIRDVSERKLLEDELRRQAFQDPLTKLANRALLLDRVAHGLARRRSDEHPLALLLLDLDDFKVVNDSLGHAAGDELLVAVADRLNSCLRTADTAARLGGDEFAVLLDQVTGQTEAAAVAERIIEQLKAPVYLDGKEVFVHASLGVALSDRDVQDAEALLRDADAAMYAAKAAGKGRCQFFEPHLHTTALDRLQRRADLERAVDQQQFVLHYQPIVELSTQQIVGAEALVRWQHPERGLVPPAEFIPLAEETGLIVPLGRWVLEQACQQAHQWHRDHPGARPLRISINLSAQQFQHPGLIAEVAHAIQTVNLDPSTLVLEITETLLMQDVQATGVKLHGLKALGVQLAIDDFGTGYSSLSYLKHFPIDILKIDKAFVEGVDGNAEDAALAHAILKLGQTLQLQTLAEGIERTKQCQALHALGCQYGQGYLFAKPVPADEILDLYLRSLAGRMIPLPAGADDLDLADLSDPYPSEIPVDLAFGDWARRTP
jgi:diguanylate cyclase (GGDEF)-like protein/PAS domain S-box-containing protein